MERDLALTGLVNARDLGGLPTRDGRRVAPRRLVRTESLSFLEPEGQQDLVDLIDPRLILDLREPEELPQGSYKLTVSSARILSLPMRPLVALTEDDVAAGLPTTLLGDYLAQLDVNVESIGAAITAIAEPTNLPVVVHCTSGKDRTGIVTALVLSLLDVPDESIIDDYALTMRAVPVLIERVQRIRAFEDNGLAMAPEWVFAADPMIMQGFLKGLRGRFGGAHGWARTAGLSDSTIQQLHSALLE